MSRQSIWTFVKVGVLGVVFCTLAGFGIISIATAALLLLAASH